MKGRWIHRCVTILSAIAVTLLLISRSRVCTPSVDIGLVTFAENLSSKSYPTKDFHLSSHSSPHTAAPIRHLSTCSHYPEESLLKAMCRIEASTVFYSSYTTPLVVAKDISLVRYYAKRDLQGWTLAYKEFSFEVVEQSYRTPVKISDMSVFLCLGIQGQDKHCLKPSAYHTFSQGQRVNQIHGLRDILWRKDALCNTVREALASYKGHKTFTFPCWVLPEDKEALKNEMKQKASNWIVKPSSKGEGHGIFVVQSFEEINPEKSNSYVVQPLLEDPFLVNGKKIDLRTYILITSMQPLRVYIYKEGLVRFASSKYDHNATRGGKEQQFLTNTSVGKKYTQLSNLTWTFQKLKQHFISKGINAKKVFEEINDAIVRTLLVSEYQFLHDFSSALGGYDCSHCFQLLGVDVILDSQLKPIVIEVNGLPSMQLSHELGTPHNPTDPYTATKLGLMHDMLQLMLTPSPVSELVNHDLKILKVGIRPGVFCDPNSHQLCVEYEDLQKLLESKRESINHGGFLRIYPTPNGERYAKLIKHMDYLIHRKFSSESSTIQTLWQHHYLYTALEKLHISSQ